MAKLQGILWSWVLLLSVIYLSRVNTQCLTGNDNPTSMDAESRNLLLDAKINFTLEALKQAVLIETEDNLFFSPHSLYEALMLAYLGAQGTTETALRKTLFIPDNLSKVDVQRAYSVEKKLREFLKDVSSNYEFATANRLWISKQKKVRECMLNLFYDELEAVDFQKDPSGIRTMINNWVSNTTRGNIQDLIPPNGVTEDTDLILTNAVYFKGLWQNRFDREKSKNGLFYGTKTSKVVFMKMKENLKHTTSEELGVHVLELPYKGQEISMFILLPPYVSTDKNESTSSAATGQSTNSTVDIKGIRQLIERMTSSKRGMNELIDILKRGLLAKEVVLSLPRFTIEKELPVKDLLTSMGAGEIFTTNKADLRGFLDNENDNLHLGDAIHRAKIELNEEGTTAAAATAILTFRSSRPVEQITFNANHPFVYLIYDRPNHSILFTGIYRSPVANTETYS